MTDDIGEAVYAVLRAAAQLSAAQARLDQQPDLAHAERDHAAGRVIEHFRRFEAAAKTARKPLTVRVTLD